ncbi:uncharacterized protein LOC134256354 [Saccostrea cucullata]|uniref:uncharacterized protein LOC134256354 n=1 Tax=Saccostrea cuccullata TaxID=36930 RepID=UPI002ED62F25
MERREEKRQEMEMQKLAMEKEAEEKKQLLEKDMEEKRQLIEKDMEEKRLQVKMRELDLQEQELKSKGTLFEAQGKEQKHEVKYLLPKYVEGEDIDVFLRSFKRLANLHKWPKPEWALRLVPQLTGKALDTYARLGEEESTDYDIIKKAILKRYDLTASTYKDKFRSCKQYPNETFREFYTRALNHFEHWCQLEKVNKRFDVLVDVILREQLVNSSSKDLQVWLKERQPKSADEMIELAEAYQNAHRGSVVTNKMQPTSTLKENKGKFKFQPTQQSNVENRSFMCQRTGHFINTCPLRKSSDKDLKSGKQWVEKPKTLQPTEGKSKVGLIHSPTRKGCDLEIPVVVESKKVSYGDKCSGLKIETGRVNGKEASVLRDTGCTSILVAEKLIRKDDLIRGE